MCERSTLVFFVNGKKISDSDVDPEWNLLYYLRTKLRLCGTKLGCSEGGCGSCTVMVSRYDRTLNKIEHYSVVSCLIPICSLHGLAVTTIEGIGSTKTRLHPLQEKLSKYNGSLCGFCAPGTIMSLYTLIRNYPNPSMQEFEIALQGHLCRCTGYSSIIKTFTCFINKPQTEQQQIGDNIVNSLITKACNLGDKCCKNTPKNSELKCDGPVNCFTNCQSKYTPSHPSQVPIFPPELKMDNKYDKAVLFFKSDTLTWFRFQHLQDLLNLKDRYPKAKIIVGNSEIEIYRKFANVQYPILLHAIKIPELNNVTITEKGVTFGAAVTLEKMEKTLIEQIEKQPKFKTKIFKQLLNITPWFACKQIRNVASIAGNIINSSPISDLNTTLGAIGAEIDIRNKNSTRIIKLDENFFTGYLQNVVGDNEIIVSISIPYTTENQYYFTYSQARRRTSDITIVNIGVFVCMKPKSDVIEKIKIIVGGMADRTLAASKVENTLVGMRWDKEMLETALNMLMKEMRVNIDVPGGMANYRNVLLLSLFYKVYLSISKKLGCDRIDSREVSGIDALKCRCLENVESNCDEITADYTLKQSSGEALYLDDLPSLNNELHMVFVKSTSPFARIKSIAACTALEMKGVKGFICANDFKTKSDVFVKGDCSNKILNTYKVKDDSSEELEIFATKIVESEGQIIGAVLATDRLIAEKAAKTIVVEYEDLQPVILRTEDAIKYKSFFGDCKVFEKGDVCAGLNKCENVLEGECRTGGQIHFNSETIGALVDPSKEELEIICSCEDPGYVNRTVAEVLKIPQTQVITKVPKQVGGGLGGKTSKALLVVLPAVIAAKEKKVPIRCVLERSEESVMSGGRHPCLMKYKVGFNGSGQISSYDVIFYLNAGRALDFSLDIIDTALIHIQNAYNIPNFRAKSYICKTNLPPNTTFTGSGANQVMFCIETVIRHIADHLKKDPLEITKLNLCKDGDVLFNNTPPLTNCSLQSCLEQVIKSSDYNNRVKLAKDYNKLNRWKKKGLSVVPVMYGVALNTNEFTIAITINSDGSVVLNHGLPETGRGLNIKLIELTSKLLQIPVENIKITEASTDKITNINLNSSNVYDIDIDVLAPALQNACDELKQKLQKYSKTKNNWSCLVKKALDKGERLSAIGTHKILSNKPENCNEIKSPFDYVYGAAVSEVEIDCLSGDHQVLRSDIVVDVGDSIIPSIDTTAISSAFITGYGLFCMEEVVYMSTGRLYSAGPGMYKLPGIMDVPLKFHVNLLKKRPVSCRNDQRASGKCDGEVAGISAKCDENFNFKVCGSSSIFLGSSILFAIRDAIKSAREDEGNCTCSFVLNAPATPERIRLLCANFLTEKVKPSESKCTYIPWSVIL